jgi:hypothetical protein
VYNYFPENNKDKAHGVVFIELDIGDIVLDTVAEMDGIRRATAEELNSMRDAINQMQIENGDPPLTEEELPIATEDEEWYAYADHVMRRLRDEKRKGNIPEKGMIAWY